jgi:hypothetical protein
MIVNGLGQTLGEGLNIMGQDKFNDWELGLSMQMPIGFRDANAPLAAPVPALSPGSRSQSRERETLKPFSRPSCASGNDREPAGARRKVAKCPGAKETEKSRFLVSRLPRLYRSLAFPH